MRVSLVDTFGILYKDKIDQIRGGVEGGRIDLLCFGGHMATHLDRGRTDTPIETKAVILAVKGDLLAFQVFRCRFVPGFRS